MQSSRRPANSSVLPMQVGRAGDPAPKLALLRSALAPEPGADAALAAHVRDAREIDLRYAEQMVLRPLDPGPGTGAEGAKAPGQATGVGAPARVNEGRSGESRRPDHRG